MTDFVTNAETDLRWLREYAEQADQDAFRSLVERYSGLVFGTAMRRTGNTDWATDITQNVFAALGLKAALLLKARIPSVGAWLHRATTLETKRHLRDQLNSRRRNQMIREELGSIEPPSEEVWNEVLPLLDEALERLSSKERDILILHYFTGLKFSEIAQHLGLRTEAAQKRCNRALEKLGRLLKTRSGAVLPTTVVAAGLTLEFAKAAPPTVIHKILNAAVIAPSGSAVGTTLTTMTLTSKTTLTGIATVLALLAVFIGGGYLLGTKVRNSEGAGTAEAMPRLQAQDSQSDEQTVLPETAPVPVIPQPEPVVEESSRPVESIVTRLRELVAERERILNEARTAMQGGGNFQIMRSYLIKVEAIHEDVEKELELLNGDYQEALSQINIGESSRSQDWLLGALFKSWGEKDPEASLVVAKAIGKAALRGVYQGWGKRDPDAALAYQRTVAAEDQSAGREALIRVFDGWVSSDPMSAVSGLQTLEFDDQKTAFKAFDDALQSESLRPRILEAVAQVEDEALRADLVADFCTNWGRIAPDEARAWFETVKFENPRASLPAAQKLVEGFAASGRIAEGADWIWPRLPEDARNEFINEVIVNEWASKDRDAAASWLRAQGLQPSLIDR